MDDTDEVRRTEGRAAAIWFAVFVALQAVLTWHDFRPLVEATTVGSVLPVAVVAVFATAVALVVGAVLLLLARRGALGVLLLAVATGGAATALGLPLSLLLAGVFVTPTLLAALGVVLAWRRGRRA